MALGPATMDTLNWPRGVVCTRWPLVSIGKWHLLSSKATSSCLPGVGAGASAMRPVIKEKKKMKATLAWETSDSRRGLFTNRATGSAAPSVMAAQHGTGRPAHAMLDVRRC